MKNMIKYWVLKAFLSSIEKKILDPNWQEWLNHDQQSRHESQDNSGAKLSEKKLRGENLFTGQAWLRTPQIWPLEKSVIIGEIIFSS